MFSLADCVFGRMFGDKGPDGKCSPVICTALTGVDNNLTKLSYTKPELKDPTTEQR